MFGVIIRSAEVRARRSAEESARSGILRWAEDVLAAPDAGADTGADAAGSAPASSC